MTRVRVPIAAVRELPFSSSQFLVLLALAAFVPSLGWLWGKVMEQHRRITTWRPADARVFESGRMRRRVGGESRQDRVVPYARYTFAVAGRWYFSDSVETAEPRVRVWVMGKPQFQDPAADQILPVGSTIRVFYDPADPSQSWTRGWYRFGGYGLVLIGLAVVNGLLALLVAWAPRPLLAPGLRLLSGDRLAARRRGGLAFAVLWTVTGAVVAGHYFMVASPQYARAAFLWTGVYFAPLVPLGRRHRRLGLTSWYLEDLRVAVDRIARTPGETMTIVAEQKLRRDALIEKIFIEARQIVSVRSDKVWSTKLKAQQGGQQHVASAYERRPAPAGETLRLETTVEAKPVDAPPVAGLKTARWEIVVVTRVRDAPEYRTSFETDEYPLAGDEAGLGEGGAGSGRGGIKPLHQGPR